MIKRFLCISWLVPVLLVGQQPEGSVTDSLYLKAYRSALADSVISTEEKALLELIKNRRPITKETQTRRLEKTSGSTFLPGVNPRRARWLSLYRNMLLGNALYGFGIPYVLGAESPSVYLGSQLLAVGIGYYIGFVKPPQKTYTLAQYYSEMSGLELVVGSILPLYSLAGSDNWDKFDPDRKIFISYMMLTAPLGIKWGQKQYNNLRVTGDLADGQSMLLHMSLYLGAYEGYKLYVMYFWDTVDDPEREELAKRYFNLAWYSGAALAYFGLRTRVRNHEITSGDAMLFRAAGIEALLVAYHLKRLLKLDLMSERDEVKRDLVDLLTLNGIVYYALRVIEKFNLNLNQAYITQLGGVAGLSAWYGVGYLLKLDFDNPFVRSVSVASTLGGWHWALHRQINESQSGAGHRKSGKQDHSAVKIQLLPQAIPGREKWHWGALVNVRF